MNGYTKTTWIDNSTPAINAENLNHIEQGIKDVTDEVIGGTLHVVDVSDGLNNAADFCTDPNILYYVRVVSSVVTWGKMYVLCTPENSVTHIKSQIAFSMDGYLMTRTFTNDVWGDWVVTPSATAISTMIQNAISGKANSSDVYTKTQADETFVDKTTYNADLGEIDEQLLRMEDTSNKVTQITGNEGVAKYPTALAVKAYADTAIAAEAAVTGAAIKSISLNESSQSITLSTGVVINEPDLITGLSIPYGTKIYVKLGFSANNNPIISGKAVQIRANGKFIASLDRGAVNTWKEVTLSGQLTSGEIITRLGVYLNANVLSTQTDFSLSVRSSIIKSINDNADNISEINADLGEIDDQLLQMEDTSNKVTQITGNESASEYPTALAVKAYVDAAIAAALNG